MGSLDVGPYIDDNLKNKDGANLFKYTQGGQSEEQPEGTKAPRESFWDRLKKKLFGGGKEEPEKPPEEELKKEKLSKLKSDIEHLAKELLGKDLKDIKGVIYDPYNIQNAEKYVYRCNEFFKFAGRKYRELLEEVKTKIKGVDEHDLYEELVNLYRVIDGLKNLQRDITTSNQRYEDYVGRKLDSLLDKLNINEIYKQIKTNDIDGLFKNCEEKLKKNAEVLCKIYKAIVEKTPWLGGEIQHYKGKREEEGNLLKAEEERLNEKETAKSEYEEILTKYVAPTVEIYIDVLKRVQTYGKIIRELKNFDIENYCKELENTPYFSNLNLERYTQ